MKLMWKGELPKEAREFLRNECMKILPLYTEDGTEDVYYWLAGFDFNIVDGCTVLWFYANADLCLPHREATLHQIDCIVKHFLYDAIPLLAVAYNVEISNLEHDGLAEYSAAGELP
jgi:hypothetical protein